jgi:cytochrome c2
MPSFGFSDEQINVLLRYFNYLDRQDFPFDASYILARHTDPKVLQVGQDLFQRLQCVKCHNLKPGQTLDPQTANQQFPSLVLVRERLKPKWVTDWLRDPNYFQKGTQMPAFWPEGSSPFPDILGGKAEEQMQAVTEYLYEYKGEDLGQAAAPAAPAKPASNVYE